MAAYLCVRCNKQFQDPAKRTDRVKCPHCKRGDMVFRDSASEQPLPERTGKVEK